MQEKELKRIEKGLRKINLKDRSKKSLRKILQPK